MTNLTLKVEQPIKIDIENFIQGKLKALAFRHPLILKSDVIIEIDNSVNTKKKCCIKLNTESSKFLVTSPNSQLKEAVDECIIILNYQLAVMT